MRTEERGHLFLESSSWYRVPGCHLQEATLTQIASSSDQGERGRGGEDDTSSRSVMNVADLVGPNREGVPIIGSGCDSQGGSGFKPTDDY